MNLTTERIALPLYLLIVATVVAVSAAVVRSSYFAADAALLGWAVSIDVAVLLPALYLIFARRSGWPLLTVIPVFVLSLVVANMLLPAEHKGIVRILEMVALPLELFLIGFVVFKVRQVVRDYRRTGTGAADFVEALQATLAGMSLPPRVVGIAATEIAVFRYGLFGWIKRQPRDDREEFTYHVEKGYGGIVAVFAFLIIVETFLVHLILLPRAPVIAWIVLALSIYGVLFLFADLNAARLRPVTIENRQLKIRVGLRWRAVIRMDDVERVERWNDDSDAWKAALIGDPNVVIHTRNPNHACGLYGMTREFDAVAIAVDDAPRFLRAFA